MRAEVGAGITLITPGVRPAGADARRPGAGRDARAGARRRRRPARDRPADHRRRRRRRGRSSALRRGAGRAARRSERALAAGHARVGCVARRRTAASLGSGVPCRPYRPAARRCDVRGDHRVALPPLTPEQRAAALEKAAAARKSAAEVKNRLKHSGGLAGRGPRRGPDRRRHRQDEGLRAARVDARRRQGAGARRSWSGSGSPRPAGCAASAPTRSPRWSASSAARPEPAGPTRRRVRG